MDQLSFRSGFVAVIGRPNVGKSTLVNAFVGEKVAIVSDKPQTTRNRIMGISNGEGWQLVFLDTPGIHLPRTKLGQMMLKSAKDALNGADAYVIMIDAQNTGERDHALVQELANIKMPKFLTVNKIDIVPKENLLALIKAFEVYPFSAVFLISALQKDGIFDLQKALVDSMPVGPKYFPDDMITDQPERFLCSELIREKTLKNLRDEVPHGIGVEMMGMKLLNEDFMEIDATVYCERDAHKRIIIGKNGEMLKKIGTEARLDIERLLNVHVNLKLFIKVRPGWRDRLDDLKTLGYYESK